MGGIKAEAEGGEHIVSEYANKYVACGGDWIECSKAANVRQMNIINTSSCNSKKNIITFPHNPLYCTGHDKRSCKDQISA